MAVPGIAQTASVGAITATADVDRFGAFNYRVPLNLPPGPGGLKPDIALLYNSQANTGILGHGWQLEGLSMIYRCTTIPELHGYRSRITFSEEDQLCLDGSYLQQIGSDEYRTHLESFTQIRRDNNGVRDTFLVRTKSGRVIRYGESDSAWIGSHKKSESPFSWLVDSISDLYGNQIQFEYFGSPRQRHVKHIRYGNNRISLQYEDRSVLRNGYVAGVFFPLSYRLKRIETYIDDSLVRTYEFEYSPDRVLDPDRLMAITECSSEGECLRPTQFVWQTMETAEFLWDDTVPKDAGNNVGHYQVADFNGDGVTDIYAISLNHREDTVYLGNTDGSFREVSGGNVDIYKKEDLSNVQVADFNGDGLMDIYHFRYRQSYDTIYLARLSQGELSFEIIEGINSGVAKRPTTGTRCVSISCLKFGDFNGDGRTDIYQVRHNYGSVEVDRVYLSNGDGTYEHINGIRSYTDLARKNLSLRELGRLQVADFNGDAVADIYQIHYQNTGLDEVYLSNGDGSYQRIAGIDTPIDSNKSAAAHMQRLKFGDFNGDGLTDLYYVTPPRSNTNIPDTIYLSKGDGTYVVKDGLNFGENRKALRTSLSRIKLADLNSDGLTDIYYTQSGNNADEIWLGSHNIQFHQKVGIDDSLNRPATEDGMARTGFADFNGDGLVDAYHINHRTNVGIQIFINQAKPVLLEEIVNGLGMRTDIVYASLPAIEQYSKEQQYQPKYTYPNSSASFPLWVVTETWVDGEPLEKFRYYDMRNNFSGLGGLGFHQVEKQNIPRQTIEQMVYRLPYPYLGKHETYIKATSNGWAIDNILYSQHNQYQVTKLNAGDTETVYLNRSDERNFDLQGNETSRVTTEYHQYDDYGNAGLVTTTTMGNGRTFSKTIRNEFDHDPQLWLLQRLVEQTTSYSDDSGVTIDHHNQFEYDHERLSVVRKIVQPGNALAYTQQYEYNQYGNVIAATYSSLNNHETERRRLYEYDEDGRFAVAVTNAEGHRITMSYDLRFGKPTVITDANQLSIHRHYDAWGRIISEQHLGATETAMHYTYALGLDAPEDSAYLIETLKAGYPEHRAYYDPQQRMIREERIGFDGRKIFQDRQYDGLLNDLIAVSVPYYQGEASAKVHWTTRDYDALGRITHEVTALPGREVSFLRTYQGHSEKQENTFGQQQTLIRDALGRVIEIKDPLGAGMTFDYDPLGRLVRFADANGAETVMTYDVFGNRTAAKDINSGSRHFSYDVFGQMTQSIDANGQKRNFYYDHLGRITQRKDNDGIARWGYDTAEYGVGKLAQESFRNHNRQFSYDNQGRLKDIDDHDLYTTINHYDEYGRLEQIDYPKGFSLRRSYNQYGHLELLQGLIKPPKDNSKLAQINLMEKAEEYGTRADFYRSISNQQFNHIAKRLEEAAHELEEGAQTLRQMYQQQESADNVGWQDCVLVSQTKLDKSEQMIADMGIVGYEYTRSYGLLAEQELAEVNRYLTCIESVELTAETGEDDRQRIDLWRVLARDATGNITSESRSNGWETHKIYDAAQRPITLKTLYEDTGKKRHLSYFYDELGNIVDRHDYVRNIDEYFEYDDLNRLISATTLEAENQTEPVRSYQYHANGNLVFKSSLGAYQYRDQGMSYMVEQVGEGTYQYDAAGYLVNAPDYSVQWNAAGKAERIDKGSVSVEYQYDADNERIGSVQSDGIKTHYVGDLFEERIGDHETNESCNKVYFERQLVAVYCEQEDSSNIYYLHHDVLGSVDTITDGDGNTLAQFDYMPFGERRTSEGDAVLSRGFSGHEHIEFANLIHMKGRIYDPQIGRFISPDPHIPAPLASQAYNNYSYVMNNPLRHNDPSGFFFKKLIKSISRLFKKVVNYVRTHARVIAAAVAGHYIGNWVAANLIKSAGSNLVWSPGGMANGSYMAAYNQIVTSSGIIGGATAGGGAALLAGGNFREVLANSVGGGVFQGVGAHYKSNWSPQRVLANSAVSGVTALAAGNSFKNAALAGLKGGALRYAAVRMRQMMIAQSMLNPDNAGGMSVGFLDDQFKLGGTRNNVLGSQDGILGGVQGGQGKLFGIAYAPGSWQDYLVEAFAGPHDFLNSWYWYDRIGNNKVGLPPLRRWVGEGLNGANIILAAPFVAASVSPDYFYSLPH